jgi:hypothetical protein
MGSDHPDIPEKIKGKQNGGRKNTRIMGMGRILLTMVLHCGRAPAKNPA